MLAWIGCRCGKVAKEECLFLWAVIGIGLAQALIHVLQLSEADRAARGALAREHILEHHSVEANAAALRRLYEQLK